MKSLFGEFSTEIVKDTTIASDPENTNSVEVVSNNYVSFIYQGNLTNATTFSAEESEDGLNWVAVASDYVHGDTTSGTGAVAGSVHVISKMNYVRLVISGGNIGDTCNIVAIKEPIHKPAN